MHNGPRSLEPPPPLQPPPPPFQPPPLPPQPTVLHLPSAQWQPTPLLPPPPLGGRLRWVQGDAGSVDVKPGPQPLQGTTSDEAVASVRQTFRCHTPSCSYLVHSDEQFGSFCCLKCHWRFVNRWSTCRKKHGPACEWRCAPSSAPVATFTAPFTASSERPSQHQAIGGRPVPSDEFVSSWSAGLVHPKPPPPLVVLPTGLGRSPLLVCMRCRSPGATAQVVILCVECKTFHALDDRAATAERTTTPRSAG